jgi:hypothetical protein
MAKLAGPVSVAGAGACASCRLAIDSLAPSPTLTSPPHVTTTSAKRKPRLSRCANMSMFKTCHLLALPLLFNVITAHYGENQPPRREFFYVGGEYRNLTVSRLLTGT